MKVVLFCGGFGTRLREHSDVIPKPLVDVGNRPILWHLMKYYAYFGHKDFILCLGYKGELIKQFFLDYNSYLYRDFTMEEGGNRLTPAVSDIADWSIQFVDTGLHANIGQRLRSVRDLLEGEDIFLANYSDQLSNFPLPDLIEFHRKKGMVASFLSAKPAQSFHQLEVDDDGVVTQFGAAAVADYWINGGYMVLSQGIFDYLEEGDELVEEPFARLMAERRLGSLKYDGFWAAMDTFKDKIMFDRMHGRGDRPWEVWPNGT
ncbi:sugar phosphate nucleotidyltransferase [Lentisalinibacter salinarum]|uniref:sugar phosphate nucleotidyltransferase n=1 Tax=Lentisalinibacter salinarum TaxID=2992239 RepID=UPI0038630FDD